MFSTRQWFRRWRAWATTAGDNTELVVEGIYRQGGPGTVVRLKPAELQGINPKILMLKLTRAKLPGFWPAVITPVPARYRTAPYKPGTYESVQVLYPDGNSVTIDSIIDAGAGPEDIDRSAD